jgi:2-polyprenyl-6-methoxyphenol hydroxylase-like FAD-dependent oxidoreductase
MGGTPTKLGEFKSIGIVGAGPVGLWTAYNILMSNEDINIVFYDKHASYVRSHILQIDVDELISNIRKYNALHSEQIKNEITNLMDGNTHISTLELESFLKGLLTTKFNERVEFITRTIVDPLFELKHDLIIGADGAKSIVRRKIFCEDLYVRENLQKIIMVKFTTDVAAKNGYLTRIYTMIKARVIHDVRYGKVNENGQIPVTMMIIPNKEIQKAMDDIPNKPVLFKNPWDIYKDNIQPNIIALITKTLSQNGFDVVNLENLDIKFIELNNYAATNFTKCNNALWLLVGDAASGVPFFRSLNKGLKEGLVLSHDICKFHKGEIFGFEKYNDFMKSNTTWEIRRARAYSLAINTRRKYLTWTGGAPDLPLPDLHLPDLPCLDLNYWIIIGIVILLTLMVLVLMFEIIKLCITNEATSILITSYKS